jgi:hypothetical protein
VSAAGDDAERSDEEEEWRISSGLPVCNDSVSVRQKSANAYF